MDAEFSKQLESGSSLPYIFSPVTALSCLVTLTCAFVVMPVIGPRITSKYGQLKENKNGFNTVLGSCTHHTLVSTLAIYALFSGTVSNRIQDQSALGFFLMQTTLGYFIGDLIAMLCDPKMRQTKLFLIHHILGIAGYAFALSSQGKGMLFAVSFQVTELSNVFINLLSAMTRAGISKDSKYYRVIGINLSVSFFLTRIVFIPWQWYEFIVLLMDPESQIIPVVLKLFTFCHFLFFHSIFIYWFGVIVKEGTINTTDKRKRHRE